MSYDVIFLREFVKQFRRLTRDVKRLISLAEYEEFMTIQYERLKDKNAFVSLDEI